MVVRTRGINRDSPLPFYEQLKQRIRQEIVDRNLGPGDLMPSEIEMCETYGVSRTVVRQAVGELVTEGLLQRLRGKGTFVARPKLREQFMESTVGFFEDLTQHGHSVHSTILSCDIVQATGQVAEALEVADKSPCIEVVRLRSVNDELAAFTKSYINSGDESLLDDLRSADLATVSLYHVLEEHWNVRIHSGHRSLEAATAKGMLAKLLEIRSGDPVLYIESIGRAVDGQPVEYFQSWHRADRTRIEIDVVRDTHPHA